MKNENYFVTVLLHIVEVTIKSSLKTTVALQQSPSKKAIQFTIATLYLQITQHINLRSKPRSVRKQGFRCI